MKEEEGGKEGNIDAEIGKCKLIIERKEGKNGNFRERRKKEE